MISLINHDSSEGEQWGRYNLPKYIYKPPLGATGDFKSHLCKPRELERSGEP